MSRYSTERSGASFLALACVGFIATAPAYAADNNPPASADDAQDHGQITVNGQVYQPKQESPKNTRPLRDTPQTVTVITAEVMQQQNILSLRDALSTVPGITFGAGEGGSGYGDSINLRGFSANNDITVDNVRDSAQYTRSDNFNIEQIEVTNGPNSVYSGSGSVAGNINLVSKRPTGSNRSVIQAGIGTDNYYRATADIEQSLSDSIGIRLNGMYHRNDVPGREVENNKRWGVMPSIAFGLNGPTKMSVLYLHQEDNNIPQFGVPYVSSVNNGFTGQVPGTSRSGYYGFRNLDKQDSTVNQLTAIFEQELSDKINLRNLTRYQDVRQYSIADGPEGTFCLPSGLQASGLPCTAAGTAPGFFTPSGGSRGNTRDTRNQMLYNQTDLKGTVNTGGIEHSFDLGASVSRETYDVRSGNSQRNSNGTTVTIPNYAWNDPNLNNRNVYTGPVNFIVSAKNHSTVENYAVYLFDTMKFSNHFELNGGVRWERNIGEFTGNTISTTAATLGQTTAVTTSGNRDSLFSYRIGAVYKPVETASLYIAYGNSKTPSQSTVNGSCTATGASQTCNVNPESAKNYEIGGKVELFNKGLLLTAAVFRTDRDSYKVASNDPTVPDQQLDGHSRVDGIALGATGHITSAWQIAANYTYLKSKLLQSISNECLAHPGPITTTTPATNPCGNSTAVLDPAKGAALNQTPKHSASLYTAYTFDFGLTVGYGATYQGKFAINLPALTSPLVSGASTLTPVLYSKDFLVHNLTLAYNITRALSAQLNVKNIGDKLYYTRIRANNGWATPGDGRSAILTLGYKF